MKLFEINDSIDELLETSYAYAEQNEGELPDSFEDDLEKLSMQKSEKIENIALYIKNIDSEIGAVDEQAKLFSGRLAKLKTKKQRTLAYLKFALAGDKFATAKVQVGYRKSESVEISVDSTDLPEEYIKTKVTVTPDKTALKKALKSGDKINGVSISVKQNISVK